MIMNLFSTVFSCLNTISTYAGPYLRVLFDWDGDVILRPCPELIEMSAALQVRILLWVDRSVSASQTGIPS